jgi:hypothetical protein
MLSIVMQSVVVLSIVMLSVAVLSIVMQSVVAPMSQGVNDTKHLMYTRLLLSQPFHVHLMPQAI